MTVVPITQKPVQISGLISIWKEPPSWKNLMVLNICSKASTNYCKICMKGFFKNEVIFIDLRRTRYVIYVRMWFFFVWSTFYRIKTKCTVPANIYLLQINNRNTRTRCEIYSKLAIKTPERHHILKRFSFYLLQLRLFKNVENCFLFYIKSSFVLKIFKFLSRFL